MYPTPRYALPAYGRGGKCAIELEMELDMCLRPITGHLSAA